MKAEYCRTDRCLGDLVGGCVPACSCNSITAKLELSLENRLPALEVPNSLRPQLPAHSLVIFATMRRVQEVALSAIATSSSSDVLMIVGVVTKDGGERC